MCSLRIFSPLPDTSPSGTRYLVAIALSAMLLYSIHKYLIRGGAGGNWWWLLGPVPLLILDSEWASGRGLEAFAH